jgi:S-DNA-T family DNA segregation ATPase FtsK/SpoIIIE
MARKTKNATSTKKSGTNPVVFFFKNRQIQTVIGSFLILFSLFLFVAFISFFFHWQQDLSIINEFTNSNAKGENLLGKVGAILSNLFIYKGVGIGAFIIPYLLFISGLFWMFRTKLSKVISSYNWGLLSMLWISVTFGFFETSSNILSGTIGYEVNEYLQLFIGKTGLGIILFFLLTAYITIRFKITPEVILNRIKSKKPEISNDNHENVIPQTTKEETTEENEVKSEFELSLKNLKPTIQNHSNVKKTTDISPIETDEPTLSISKKLDKTVDIDVTEITEEENVTENLSKKLVEDFGEFDPTLELANYKFPTLNLLKQYNESISVDPEELEQNKNKIVDTLKNYKIGIAQIKATVGPTITLYEIVPEAGIRISKIKNLEDDIALSLSALGIRIIAPIPGKGTIGIEVPNKKSTIVSMHSVIASKRFQESKMELPIALGKTISNETFVVDLAKMPHLLMAGATGQGKSVGLNAVLTSLLYRKHPAEVKFVLVDPKKVELTLFNKIERHYLAKLPDTDEAIITDTTKVVNTLNSLCIEMDNRYDLLKSAMVRNIKEYNTKFKARKLNPNEGHQFLPYIVLVIDEFADLIMTAGKEVETPIARLAQLARAIGIHLIVATQRPSVNVITGIIKANFPARIAFRVTSKIDSRTILDAGGADQLIGRGDLLYTAGNEIERIQCAFVDTPEVSKITDFIGSQRAYPNAHLLPEYIGEEGGTSLDIDISDRDKLFREAAEVIVIAQQGSASLLQRKLKLGYNRAGRLIDQLEAAGIVGHFEGSKARQVLVTDLIALDQLLENEKNA